MKSENVATCVRYTDSDNPSDAVRLTDILSYCLIAINTQWKHQYRVRSLLFTFLKPKYCCCCYYYCSLITGLLSGQVLFAWHFASVMQAKGVHDHPRPEAKSTSEARRSLGAGRRVRGLAVLLAREAALGSKVTVSVAQKCPHLCTLLTFIKGYNLHLTNT